MQTPKKMSPHFFYHEFFSQGIWQSNDEKTLRRLIDQRLINIMEKIRTDLGKPIFINNWKWGGNSMYRGFRPTSTTVGAQYSQHKFGRAVDFQVKHKSVLQVHRHILNNQRAFMDMGVTRLEDRRDAPTWIHLDLAWTGADDIVVFRA